MATQAKKIEVLLREDLARGYEPLPAGRPRVDRERGIIFGVKIAGLSSSNKHGTQAKGTRYKTEAFKKALPLYEGAKCNVNHPDRKEPNKDRDADDRFGKFLNVRIYNGEPYGDLHYLKSHPMAPRVTEAAEREEMADCFALSHNAFGAGNVEDGYFVIHEIGQVRSVDLVADGGTCKSLFENAEFEEPMKKTLRVLVAEAKKIPAPLRAGLLEMDDAMLDQPMPAAGAPEDKDWKAHLSDAIGKLVASDKAEDHDMARKILGMLKPESAKSESSSAPAKEGEEKPKADDKDKEKDVKESRELAALKNFKAVTELCESKKFAPTVAQRKALEALSTDEDRKALIDELHKAPAKSGGPRSSAPGQPLREGQEVPQDYSAWKSRATALLN